jgi:erythromycin esterase-like protein
LAITTHPAVQDAVWAFADRGPGVAVTAFLHSLRTRPRLLGLGEPMHGEVAFPRLRNQLFRHLVEHEGYRSIALESDAVAGLLVDGFVTEGVGSLDEVLQRGFSHGFGDTAANRQLVQWMREYNRDRPAADRLRFFGFDAPLEMTSAASPRGTLTALHRYLAARLDADLIPHAAGAIDRLIGDDQRWTNPQAVMDPSQSLGSSPDVAQLRLIADDLLTLLMSQSPHLLATTSHDEWWQAQLYGRTAAGLLRYHVGTANASATRVARLLGLRDTMMADNLKAIVEHQAQRGPTLAFAHNLHLQKHPSRWHLAGQDLEWWSAGAIVGAHLSHQYVFLATDLGAAPHQGLNPPRADTLEGILSTLPQERYVIDGRRLVAALASMSTALALRTDTSTNHGYFALDPGHLEETDGLIFIKHLAPSAAETPPAGPSTPPSAPLAVRRTGRSPWRPRPSVHPS